MGVMGGEGRRWGLGAQGAAALLLLAGLAACGGRAANPVATTSTVDARLTCAHLDAEIVANNRRIEDLGDERNANRLRSLSRAPGALIGSPISAIILADPSLAIYQEIDALERRNVQVGQLRRDQGCDGEPPAPARRAPEPTLIDADSYTTAVEPAPAANPAPSPAPQSAAPTTDTF